MRRTAAPRLNRLPQRLDYTLIPAPLDLSLPLVDEKAPLPAIIVTPSSPSHETDFAIAFLAPPPKPSLCEQISSHLPSLPSLPSFTPRLPSQIQLPASPFKNDFDNGTSWSLKMRARTTILFAILLFIMACHLIMHSMITGHPHLEFGVASENDMVALNSLIPPTARYDTALPDVSPVDTSSIPSIGGWLNLPAWWAPMPLMDGKRSARFIVSDVDPEAIQAP